MQTNPPPRDGREDDELLRRIDDQTGPPDADAPAARTLEQRLRLLLPGHTHFRSLVDTPRGKMLDQLLDGALSEANGMFEVEWTLPQEKWGLAFVDDHGEVTGGILCKAANDAGGSWRLHEVTADRFIEVLRVLGAIRE